MARAGAPPESAGGDAPPPAISGPVLAGLALELDVELTPQQSARLVQYAALLRRWNRVHNLTSVDSNADLLTHHLLDCLAIVRPLQEHFAALPQSGTLSFLDAGSGGGLPGIPLAIALPEWRGTLVDAVQKKCAFLEQARLELGLPNIAVRHARLESLPLAASGLVVSRAFASLDDFVRLTWALLEPGGYWAAMKGRQPEAELAQVPAGAEHVGTITLRVPLLDEQRHLVILRKAPGAPAPARRP